MPAANTGAHKSRLDDISILTWAEKYRHCDLSGAVESRIEDTWRRVARALAMAEKPPERSYWEERFYAILRDFRFLPGGRILAGAGTGQRVTLFNCFVMGVMDDSLDGIFDALKEGALTMQQGGGIGYDFSPLRPAGLQARGTGMIASGPVSFMRIWDAMCSTILSTGARRGAMMATLRCDHPDIEAFIAAKREKGELRNFNQSVLVTDAFMDAVRDDAEWPLMFPADVPGRLPESRPHQMPAAASTVAVRNVRARALWDAILRANYEYAEPGVIFIDRVQRANNLYYCERINATNPCGEVPLPAYGACDLGSINLAQFVRMPFTSEAELDIENIKATAAIAVRLLDNVYDVSGFPLAAQRARALESRRLGLGITGLADALLMLGLRYDTEKARQIAATAMRAVCHSAYRASVGLAREKGAFPAFEASPYLQGELIRTLPENILHDMAQYGIRNSHLTAIAPAGTISLLAGNVSSGIEPVFAAQFSRNVRRSSGEIETFAVMDYAVRVFRKLMQDDAALPPTMQVAADISPDNQLLMQAVLQPHVDNAISKTVNIPENMKFDLFRRIYGQAHMLGLKGCTTFRPNPVTGSVLFAADVPAHCCAVEREAD